MPPIHSEAAFGEAIVAAMTARGWREVQPQDYRVDLGLDTNELFTFIGATQAEAWGELVDLQYGGDPNAAQLGFAKRLGEAIKDVGLTKVLHDGLKDRGTHLRVAYFRPNLVVDESTLADYHANRLTVVRELAYATKQADHGKRLDLTLFLNGIPVATAELKNPLTGQGAEQAKEQYRRDRDDSELIFAQRSVVNFAIDPDLVFVTTRLRGGKTLFLPFNTGSSGPGLPGGQGNPTHTTPGRYATSYLWEQVWQRDNWLDLLHRFVHVHKEKPASGGGSTSKLIFPRYHQWDAVKKLAAHAAIHGAGHNYLVMASAGSGKSNTIGWLAHRLSDLHTPTDPAALDPEARAAGLLPGVPVFDKVIVITDRRNLDSQLRETVGSFEQTAGLVVKIDESHGAKGAQLAQALSQQTGKIITVTLHSFPALLDYLKRNPTEIQGSRFAIVVDEAHSSQSGDAATAVRAALRDLGLDADDEDAGASELAVTVEQQLKKRALQRSQAANLSYFAFTATPKSKTLELFGELEQIDGVATYRPFHTYSMRQAIEEGFILDPLRNYVTYDTYYKLVNQNDTEREVDPTKANPLLARFALTHASTVAQHAQVIVEHFVTHTRGRLGGRAKAMVVTASRQSAVQMSRAIKSYILDRDYHTRYPDLGVLVAFSGTLNYEGEETTEPKENGGLSESGLPKAFGYTRADDKAVKAGGPGKPEFRILIVAEKYQTGFDQPLLTTMYVNKTLTGISAVQTLSRLNRTAERKTQADLAVLDFVNDAEAVKDAFVPYFREAQTLPSDPNLLYQAQSRVMGVDILSAKDMDEFAAAYFEAQERAAGSAKKWEQLHAELYRLLAPSVDRFAALLFSDDEEDRQTAEAFRADLNDYVRKYGFVAQILSYQDAELERLHLYGRHLLNRLPRLADGGVDVGDIDLSHLRVQRTGEYDLGLTEEGASLIRNVGEGAGGVKEDEKSLLSELIERFNDKFGTAFTEQDVLPAWQATTEDLEVRQAAVVNDEENFGKVFDRVFADKVEEYVGVVTDLGKRYFAQDRGFKSSLDRSARRAAWRMIRREEGVDDVA
ncbi:type I restriction endonuclease subunit R [Streptacidiphilus fuscans]|uniref:Type I restriction endonuclease subunit R n=1 Tax=Streptacidiphilus fuscans TaxID=2789292 RepID=A0A931B8N7_9ACTN|nr:type I restriction endonuclease [Streptacidiphilus fuscans]MBF9072238.1 type I restriction endonuclease subunit R [Streptacidiphilus fuscans]